MERLMTHDEAQDLLGAFALDAVEADEAEAIEAHLETCPRCRDELRGHLEVVGLLAYAGGEAPAGVWDRVVASIHADTEPAKPATILRLVPRRRPAYMVLAAAAAAVVVALLGVQVNRLQNRTDHLSHQVAIMANQPTMATVDAALRVRGAQQVALRPLAGGPASLDAVILPGGQGYLYDSKLSPLDAALTYQLWGVVEGERISYGLIGSSPSAVVPFRAGSGVQALAVTQEVAGGVVTSTKSPVVVGSVA
jgi:hypothetical protein